MTAMRTGFFGGSFNPIHNGHIALAKSIMRLAGLDEVWFVVSPHNPLKDSASLLPDGDRLNMVKLALKDEPGLMACDYEFHLPKPSYTLHTLSAISKDYPERQFVLLIGADNWQCFDKWYGYREILSRYEIAIYPRQGSSIDSDSLPENVRLLQTGLFNVSSTQVRSLLAAGQSADSLLPPAVARYIKDNRLFTANKKRQQ